MTDTDEDLTSRRLAATLRRMRGQPHKPTGVSADDLRDVMDRGLMTFIVGQFALGLYLPTDAGHEFLREH